MAGVICQSEQATKHAQHDGDENNDQVASPADAICSNQSAQPGLPSCAAPIADDVPRPYFSWQNRIYADRAVLVRPQRDGFLRKFV